MRSTLLSVLLFASLLSGEAPRRYDAQIRRTSYGIPHITAADYGSLGFGEGYAQAEDHLCSIADLVVKAHGERARFFGPGKGDEHLRHDIAMKALDIVGRGRLALSKQPAELRDWYDGFAAGYNHYLQKTGVAKVPGWCQGSDWVKPITAADISAYQQITLLVTTQFAPLIATATPPGGPPTAAVTWDAPDLASNGWGLGKDRTARGRGMLLANPHYPWVGSNRFWEKHLTVPGKLNVYGVGLVGNLGVAIGFNRDVAWTHTVSAGKRFTLFALDLVPGRPTVYRYDKEERAMTSKVITVDVRQPNGSLKTVEKVVWYSHYGPIVNMPGLGWTQQRAIAIKDANVENYSSNAQWFDMGRARSMKEFQQAHERHQGMPWVNTISSSREGIAWYTDSASTPDLSKEALAAWLADRKSNALTARLWQQGLVLLNGSDPRFDWKGVVPFRRVPQLERTDYVFNANDSFWLANSKAPLEGEYSPLHGEQRSVRSLRTRNNDLTLSGLSPDRPAGADNKFTLDELGNAILSNRSLAAELFKDELIARCKQRPSVAIDGASVDLTQACEILGMWDGRFDLESRGAPIFREFLSQFNGADFAAAGSLYGEPFNPADPVGTPRRLANGDTALVNLARAVKILNARHIALDTPLGELQYADKAGRRMPVHGGDGAIDGLMNMQRNARNTTTLEPMDEPKPVPGSRTLTEKGYPVVHGSSFIMVLEFTGKGPNAKAFLTYSESGDPKSPHFTDQTELFAKKQWRPVLFDPKRIASDVKQSYRVTSHP